MAKVDLKAIKTANETRIAAYIKTRKEFSVGGSPWDYSDIPADRDISDLLGLEDEEVEKEVMTGKIVSFLEGRDRQDKHKRTFRQAIVAVKVGSSVITTIGPTYIEEVGTEVTFTGVLVAKGSEFLHVKSEQNGGKAVIITANRPTIKTFGFLN